MANFYRYIAASALAFVCAVAVALTLSYGTNDDSDEWSSMASEVFSSSWIRRAIRDSFGTIVGCSSLPRLSHRHHLRCPLPLSKNWNESM
jgi:Ni,Fe-hydrogenase III component G